MRFLSWLRNRNHPRAVARGRAPAAPRKRAPFRPRLEALEGRDVPTILHVTTALDTGSVGDGSLRGELGAAQSGDTIVFDPNLNGQTINITGEFRIATNITIQGPGADQLTIAESSIGYAANPRLFEIEANANVTLSGLTLTGGGGTADGYVNNGPNDPAPYDDDGGAILNFGTLTINNSTLTGNGSLGSFATSTTFCGGAIYNAGTLTVNNSMLSGNFAGFLGTLVSGDGGGIYNAGSLTVAGSTLSDNHAYGGSGGALYNVGSLTVSGSILSGNSATVSGGAIVGGGPLTVTGGAITNNSAQYGGGINGGGSTLMTLTGVSLSGNTAYDGGAIYNFGQMTLVGCDVEGNTATDAGRWHLQLPHQEGKTDASVRDQGDQQLRPRGCRPLQPRLGEDQQGQHRRRDRPLTLPPGQRGRGRTVGRVTGT